MLTGTMLSEGSLYWKYVCFYWGKKNIYTALFIMKWGTILLGYRENVIFGTNIFIEL
jgi:hypothetical protein